MSGLRDEDLLEVVRTVWAQRDPVPDGLVARLQEATALAAGSDFDVELMLLVERSDELAGARGGSTAYTLRFAHEGADLLVRVTEGRLDGWIVPPSPLTVSVLRGGEQLTVVDVGATGRFELVDLTPGLLSLRLEPHDGSTPFQTPSFEI